MKKKKTLIAKKEMLKAKLRERQEKKRKKIRDLDGLEQEVSPEPSPEKIEVRETLEPVPVVPKQKKLTENNVKKHEKKPKWAFTEQQLGLDEEEDVDDLLNFANNLDYNQFIEDIEIRAALKAIRDKVKR